MLHDPGVGGRHALAAWALALVLVAPAASETVTVGPLDGTCPDAIFARIQSALDAAVPGTTIALCPGTYAEQLLVTKRVHLVAAAGARLVPPPLTALTTSLASGRAVAAAVTLRAPAIIEGLAIDASAHGITTCDGTEPLLVGIYVGGVTASLLGNAVTGTRIPNAPAGCTNGVAILAEGGGALRIDGNSLDRYGEAGVLVQGAGVRAVVSENLVEGDGGAGASPQSGIVVASAAAARIQDNVVRAHAGVDATGCAADAGIVLAAPRLKVTGNLLQANAVGVRADSRGHVIGSNAVDGADVGLVGLDLDADESRVVANVFANESVAGIRVVGNRSRLRGNTLTVVHEIPRCAALRTDDGACAGLLARCGAGIWLLGRANQVVATAISDVDVPVVDDGRDNVVRPPTP